MRILWHHRSNGSSYLSIYAVVDLEAEYDRLFNTAEEEAEPAVPITNVVD